MSEVTALKHSNDAVKVIEKTIPGVKIFNLNDTKGGLDINRQSTGSMKIDGITGGGLPEGRIVELFGAESSGKTSINLIFAASYTSQKKPVLFIDAEHAFDPEYAAKLGVDISYVYVVQPDYGEQSFSVLEGAVKSGAFPLIIVDSVSALTPKVLLDSDIEDNAKIGALAALMSRGLQKLVATISNSKTTVSFINQTRVKIGWFAPGMGVPKDTTGGNALKFYSSIRIDVRRGQDIKRGTLKIGQEIKVRTIKNKTFPPFKETIVNLMHDPENDNWGLSVESEVFDSIIDNNILGSRGSYITLRGEKVKGAAGVPGRDLLWQYLNENRDEFDYLIEKCMNGGLEDVTPLRKEDGSIEGFQPTEEIPATIKNTEDVDPLMVLQEEEVPLIQATEIEKPLISEQKTPEEIENESFITVARDIISKDGKIEPKDLVEEVKESGWEITWAKAKDIIKAAKTK